MTDFLSNPINTLNNFIKIQESKYRGKMVDICVPADVDTDAFVTNGRKIYYVHVVGQNESVRENIVKYWHQLPDNCNNVVIYSAEIYNFLYDF